MWIALLIIFLIIFFLLVIFLPYEDLSWGYVLGTSTAIFLLLIIAGIFLIIIIGVIIGVLLLLKALLAN